MDSGLLSISGQDANFHIVFSATVAQSAKVAVLAVSTDNEVLVDATVLTVEAELPNQVSIQS